MEGSPFSTPSASSWSRNIDSNGSLNGDLWVRRHQESCRRRKRWQQDQVVPIPPYPHAATQGSEVGKAKDWPKPLRDDGGKMKSGTGTAQHPHQAGRQQTSKPSSAAWWIPSEVGQAKGTWDHSHRQLPKGTTGTSNKPARVHQPRSKAGDGTQASQQAPLVLRVTASNPGPIPRARMSPPVGGREHDRVRVSDTTLGQIK